MTAACQSPPETLEKLWTPALPAQYYPLLTPRRIAPWQCGMRRGFQALWYGSAHRAAAPDYKKLWQMRGLFGATFFGVIQSITVMDHFLDQ